MNTNGKAAFLPLLMIFILSCGKEELLDSAPSLVGHWQHYVSETEREVILIEGDGTGKVQWYSGISLKRETKIKTWKIDGNRMYLGNVTFNLKPYDIDEYPQVSSSTTYEGLDTLYQGKSYVVLNDLFYTEIE